MKNITLILFYISIIQPAEFSFEMSTPLQNMQRRYYGHVKAFGDSKKVSDVMCDTSSHCQCKSTSYGFFYQCDMMLYAECYRRRPFIHIYCNHTVERQAIREHIRYLTSIADKKPTGVFLYDCPPDSVSDFLYPDKIKSLSLSCEKRENFVLNADQFRNLSNLQNFGMYCDSVTNLPANLFQAMDLKLSGIIIERTKIKSLGNGLLCNLTHLRDLRFTNNAQLTFQNSDFVGLKKLDMLGIENCPSVSMEEDQFEPIANITKLYIVDSGIRSFPKSFKMLEKLQYLEIIDTLMEWIGNDLCEHPFHSIESITIKRNPSLDIHPDCLQSYNNSNDIELSGNYISNLPNRTIMLNQLMSFKFNDNGRDIKSVENFIWSESLSYIEMSNSSITFFHKDFLRNVPSLIRLDLSNNLISFIDEAFFESCEQLNFVSLQGNKLKSIPVSLFVGKPLLSEIIASHNNISEVNFRIGQNLSSLRYLDISHNKITLIPSNPFSKLSNIQFLEVSNNEISEVEDEAMEFMNDLITLNIGKNKLKGNFFFHKRKFEFLTNLSADGNFFSELSWLDMPTLYDLNLSNNMLKRLDLNVFNSSANIGVLNLSRNEIEELPRQKFFSHLKHLTSLDLSFNRLKTCPEYIHSGILLGRDHYVTVFYDLKLEFLDLSGNLMEKFRLDWLGDAKSIKKASIRNNSIQELYSNSTEIPHVSILDLSHNKISSKNWPWYYDDLLKTSGKISPFSYFEYLEELNLAYNEITDIAIDFRIHNAHLKILDLSFNKIKRITHQELLFSTYHFDEDSNAKPYGSCRSLMIDLRNNLIRRVNLPHSMLLRNVSRCEKHRYSHATILVGHNPFECGCQVIPFLRVAEGNVVLTSELWRTAGIDWMLQARINTVNLTCRYPQTVSGKEVLATESWMHHLLPTMGYCYLSEDSDYMDYK